MSANPPPNKPGIMGAWVKVSGHPTPAVNGYYTIIPSEGDPSVPAKNGAYHFVSADHTYVIDGVPPAWAITTFASTIKIGTVTGTYPGPPNPVAQSYTTNPDNPLFPPTNSWVPSVTIEINYSAAELDHRLTALDKATKAHVALSDAQAAKTVRALLGVEEGQEIGGVGGAEPSDATPQAIVFGGTGDPGDAETFSRADHIHPAPIIDIDSMMPAILGALPAAIVNTTYNASCVKNGTVFALTLIDAPSPLPDIFGVRFKAPAAYEEGDSFTINGDGYEAKTIRGFALPDGAFAAGAVVKIDADADAETAFVPSVLDSTRTETIDDPLAGIEWPDVIIGGITGFDSPANGRYFHFGTGTNWRHVNAGVGDVVELANIHFATDHWNIFSMDMIQSYDTNPQNPLWPPATGWTVLGNPLPNIIITLVPPEQDMQ